MGFCKGHTTWNKGRKVSEQHKKRLSELNKGQISWNKGKIMPDEFKEKIRKALNTPEVKAKLSAAQKGKKLSEKTKKKLSEANKGQISNNKGKHLSNETKNKLSKAMIGNKNARGRITSLETKKKMRISAIRYIKETRGISPREGINEKDLLDLQEHFDSCKIQRNYEIKDLGYFVDGYCRETNTVYEVYEKYHNTQVQKDLQREFEIRSHLNCCNFVIIHDKTH